MSSQSSSQEIISQSSSQEPIEIEDAETEQTETVEPVTREKPAQKKAQEKIAVLNKQITSLTALREAGLSGVTKVQIDNVRKKLNKERMGFKKSQREAKRQLTRRRKQREVTEQLCEEDAKAGGGTKIV